MAENSTESTESAQPSTIPAPTTQPTNQKTPAQQAHKSRLVARTKQLKARMLESLNQTHGLVMHAAGLAGINARSHERWVENDPEYAAKVAHFKRDRLDMAESVVLAAIANQRERPELALKAAIFTLEQQGAERGYGKQGVAVQVNTQINQQHEGPIWEVKRMLEKAAKEEHDAAKQD